MSPTTCRPASMHWADVSEIVWIETDKVQKGLAELALRASQHCLASTMLLNHWPPEGSTVFSHAPCLLESQSPLLFQDCHNCCD